MSKFNKRLVEDVKKDLKASEEQKNIRNKYHIEADAEKIVVVRRNILKTMLTIVHILFNIIFFTLAIIGLAALIYPGSREELLKQINAVYLQLKVLLTIP